METGYGTEQLKKLGICVLCGSRVTEKQSYVTAEEGYCHTECLEAREAFK